MISLAVNVIQDAGSVRARVVLLDVGFDPRYKVVFECSFDDLVQDVGGKKFVNICAWKVLGKWLLMDSGAKTSVNVCGAER